MYGRDYGGKQLHFEASGGLLHASLVMRDKETDSWWSLMDERALAGELAGTRLHELPVSTKTQWKRWVTDHPDTLVLSVDGKEHESTNPYENYFASDEGFRGVVVEDERLPTKAPIFAFQIEERAFAAQFASFENGALFEAGSQQVFLYRPTGVAVFHSTVAFHAAAPGFRRDERGWIHVASGARFDAEQGRFSGGDALPDRLPGFDTYWFNWSMNNPDSEILAAAR